MNDVSRADGQGTSVVQVFELSSTLEAARVKAQTLRDRDDRRVTEALIERLETSGPTRALTEVPRQCEDRLACLAHDFPNFTEVTEFLRYQFAANGGTGFPVRFDPILLNGPPGIGKTLFSSRLASTISCASRSLRMENAQSSSPITGSDEFWSNSKPGAVFDALVNGNNANPLFFLDEVDKVTTDSRYDPLSGMYALLEPDTARCFADAAYPWLLLDAGHINWVLTSNDASQLPAPIRSRLKQFNIPELTAAQSQRVTVRIFQELQHALSVARDLRLTCATVRMLAGQSPRRVQKVLKEAIGKAVVEKRRRICPQDLCMDAAASTQRRIGFI